MNDYIIFYDILSSTGVVSGKGYSNIVCNKITSADDLKNISDAFKEKENIDIFITNFVLINGL